MSFYSLSSKIGKCSIAIGKFPDIDSATARKVARGYKSQIAEGVDPKAERDKVSVFSTVKSFFYESYLPLAKQRKRSWNDDEHRFRLHCVDLFTTPYHELTARHVLNVQLQMRTESSNRAVYRPATCNRVLALLKVVGKLAEQLLDIPNVAKKASLLPENNTRILYCNPRLSCSRQH